MYGPPSESNVVNDEYECKFRVIDEDYGKNICHYIRKLGKP
jgi:hypothetical protein